MRYIVPGVPPGAQPSAFTPHMNSPANSGWQQYKTLVDGQPGTRGVPAPTRDTAPSPDLGDIAMMGTARSSDAPDMIYPNQYYERGLWECPGAGMPIRVYSDDLMPVPATDPRGTPARLSRPVNRRGQTAVNQPRVIPSWGAPYA